MKISDLKKILKENNISPKKIWGQNFLLSHNIAEKLINSINPLSDDFVIEIGPGLGFITEILKPLVGRILAVEIDKSLSLYLKEKFKNSKNVKIINSDILKTDLSLSKVKNYKVLGSLPYSGAFLIIRKFLEKKDPPLTMAFIIQKEVAQKICSKKMNFPKAVINFYARAEIISYVPKSLFWPKPKVDGAIIRIYDIQKNTPAIDSKIFFETLKRGFSFPRKTLLNNLSKSLKIPKTELLSFKNYRKLFKKRPEDLSFDEWIELSLFLKNFYDKIIEENENCKTKRNS